MYGQGQVAGLPFIYGQRDSMRGVARLMQLVGLTAPPLAIVLQLSETISLGQMLTILVASVCLFWIGRIMEGYSR